MRIQPIERQRGQSGWRWLAAMVLAALLVGLPAGVSARPTGKLDRFLEQHAAHAPAADVYPVIVTVRPGARRGVLKKLLAHGADVRAEFGIIEAVAADLPAGLIRSLAKDKDVLALSFDSPVTVSGVSGAVTGTAVNSGYTLRRTLGVDGPATTSPLTGAGVTVAIIDSGIYKAPDFGARITRLVDLTGGTGNDTYGHGTHVAGIIGGGATEVPGIAKGVKLVGLRVLDGQGSGFTSHVISALQSAVDNRVTWGIDIVNMSLGHPIYEPAATDPLVQAVEAAVRSGIVVVVSAGNVGMNPETGLVGYGGISSPGNAPSAITVGAVRTQNTTSRIDDVVADYSSRGPTWFDANAKPDIVAPGHRVLATSDQFMYLYQAYPLLQGPPASRGKEYMYLSGTSMATGVASATVALMIEASKEAFGVTPAPNAIKAMLMHAAFPMTDAAGAPYDTLTQGAGALNGGGAIALAQTIDPRAAAGSYWLTSSVTETTPVDGQVIAWGRNIVWGDNIIWGDALYTNRSAWSPNIVWGDDTVWSESLAGMTGATEIVWGAAYNAVWGSNIVWGDACNIVWGDARNIVWGDARNIVWGDARNIVWGDLSQGAEFTGSLGGLNTSR